MNDASDKFRKQPPENVSLAPASRIKDFFAKTAPYLAALFLLLVFSLCNRQNGEPWLSLMINQTTPTILASAGQAVVLLVNGIDFSVAGVMTLANCLCASLMLDNPVMMILLCIGILLFGAAAGLLNGYIIVRFRLRPYLVTFVTWFIWQGLAFWILPMKKWLGNSGFSGALTGSIGVLPISLLIIAAVCILWFYLRRTYFGIALYAIAHDEMTARYSGINVETVTIRAYTVSGCLSAAAGIFYTSLVGYGVTSSGDSFILLTICAALLGGIGAANNKGGLYGTIAGCFILELFIEILLYFNVPVYWAQLVRGLLFLFAIFISTVFRITAKNR